MLYIRTHFLNCLLKVMLGNRLPNSLPHKKRVITLSCIRGQERHRIVVESTLRHCVSQNDKQSGPCMFLGLLGQLRFDIPELYIAPARTLNRIWSFASKVPPTA